MGCSSCNTLDKKKSGCKKSGSCSRCNKFSVFDWLGNLAPPNNKKCLTVEVSFKNGRKRYYENKKNIAIKIGDPIVVKCNVGHDIGLVSLTGELVRLQLRRKKINLHESDYILRRALQSGLDLWQNFISLEKNTLLKSREIVRSLKLEMKVTDVEYQADGRIATFYYLSEGRVDFRGLIKLLLREFNTKVLLRQFGARQESAMLGGVGSCGRELCCASWLMDIRSVSISAARYQKLSLNPKKLTGQCGKLKCCLNYELENYMDALKDFPNIKTIIKTKKGNACVEKVDIFKKIIWYSYVRSQQDWIQVSVSGVKKMIKLNQRGHFDFLIEDFVSPSKNIKTL